MLEMHLRQEVRPEMGNSRFSSFADFSVEVWLTQCQWDIRFEYGRLAQAILVFVSDFIFGRLFSNPQIPNLDFSLTQCRIFKCPGLGCICMSLNV
jgi:hypothetical protein